MLRCRGRAGAIGAGMLICAFAAVAGCDGNLSRGIGGLDVADGGSPDGQGYDCPDGEVYSETLAKCVDDIGGTDTGGTDTGGNVSGGDDTGSDAEGDGNRDDDADTGDAPSDTSEDTAADTPRDTPGNDVLDVADTGGELDRDAPPTAFGAGSVISEFYIDADSQTRSNRPSGAPRCCFDVQIKNADRDYDGENDNAFAEWMDDVVLRIDDANDNINHGIRQGNFVYLFEYRDWDSSNWQQDGSITMYAHPGRDANSPWDWNQVRMGNGTFEILPDSYATNGNPKFEFNTVSSAPDGSGADLSAEDGTVNLLLDLGQGVSTTFTVERAELTADIPNNADVASGGEVAMWNGELGGAIPKDNLYTGLNGLAANCSCYDMNTNRLFQKQSAETYQCEVQSSCGCSGTPDVLERSCPDVREGIANATDVNLNGASPANDALSFGANFSAAEATISGVAP